MEGCDTLVVFDAGTGIARFAEPWAQEVLKRHSKVLLLLSHYHIDHVAGLIYIPFFFKEKKICIAGPGKKIYGRSAEEILCELITPPYFGRRLTDFTIDLDVHDLDTGMNTIGGIKVETVLQEHSDPSLGLKVNDTVCYITDTACSGSSLDFISGSRLLLHETWLDRNDYKKDPNALLAHSAIQQVAEMASRAGVESLLLIHLNPGYDEQRLIAMERDAQELFANAQLARDGVSISLKSIGISNNP
jgi:ribonuclease BN (tRNA processing enzyme)